MDIWRVGVVDKSARDVVANGFGDAKVRWFEGRRRFSFLADPFGLWRNERLSVFAEAYDYRTRLGHIEVLQFDRGLNLLDRRPCLAESWHLSYPYVFESGGEVWMLPEAHRSGTLTLYHGRGFPNAWQAECTIDLPELAVDATPLRYRGLWWMFYTPAKRSGSAQLHAAFADRLCGHWSPHPMNPLIEGPIASRPGGTPIIDDERILLPLQNCVNGYGSGIGIVELRDLTRDSVRISPATAVPPPLAATPFTDGFHTLSSAGNVTLIDVKRCEDSLSRLPIDALGRVRRAVRRSIRRWR